MTGQDAAKRSDRRPPFVMENWSSWLGWTVKERNGKRLAVFFKRRHAQLFRDALNAGEVKP